MGSLFSQKREQLSFIIMGGKMCFNGICINFANILKVIELSILEVYERKKENSSRRQDRILQLLVNYAIPN